MRNVDVRNLTPHRLNIIADDGFVIEIEPSGDVARCDVSKDEVETVMIQGHPVTISKSLFGNPNGVPTPEEDVINVTSMVVAKAVQRLDVTSPGDLVRNDAGAPVGCKGLSLPN